MTSSARRPVVRVLLFAVGLAVVLGAGGLVFGAGAAAGGVVGALAAGLPAVLPAMAVARGDDLTREALRSTGIRSVLVLGAGAAAFAKFGASAVSFVLALAVAYLVSLAVETALLVRACARTPASDAVQR